MFVNQPPNKRRADEDDEDFYDDYDVYDEEDDEDDDWDEVDYKAWLNQDWNDE
jgi:hypothetical protein